MAEPKNKQEGRSEQQRSESADRTPAAAGRREQGAGIIRRDPWTMSPFTGSPFGFMRRFTEEMERLFEDFGFGRGWPERAGDARPFAGGLWSPHLEMFERDNRLVVRADLPGLTREDIDVEIRDDELVLSGERKDEREEQREGFYRSERSYGRFYRSIPLPEGVNPDSAKASFKNGVLEITLDAPPRPAARSRRVEIEGGTGTGQGRQPEKTA